MRRPICDGKNVSSLYRELRRAARTQSPEGVQGRGKETARKTQLTALEGVSNMLGLEIY